MRAMARAGGGAALVELKAVDGAYPLAGALRLSGGMALADALGDGGAVVEAALLERLGLAIGDRIEVGDGSFTVRATLEREPDRAVGLFSFGPRFMLDREGLRRTGLVQPGSLIRYKYRIALDEPGRTVRGAPPPGRRLRRPGLAGDGHRLGRPWPPADHPAAYAVHDAGRARRVDHRRHRRRQCGARASGLPAVRRSRRSAALAPRRG